MLSSLADVLDSEVFRQKALDIKQGLPEEELNQWKAHPLTKWLLFTLTADYLDYHSGWESGSFTSESAEGTAQLNAQSLGAIDALHRIVTDIEELTPDDQHEGL